MLLRQVFSRLVRKKTVVISTLHDTKLRRCLGIADLVGLGLGSSLGLGVYVLTSYAIKNEAGPSFVISVILAGVTALFSGLCYAELSARLPRAGGSYLYSYATLGELCGFFVGWNMILENLIGGAAAAKAWSQYFDFMLNGTVKRVLEDTLKLPVTSISTDYPDLLSFGVLLIITFAVASGSKISSRINIILVFVNILIILCFVCVGYFHVEHENWTDPPGFFAHGFKGILAGAAVLFFAFSNFEIVASASEEAKDPSKTVPTAIMLTVFISAAMYFCISTSTTLSLHSSEMGSTVSLPKLLNSLHITGASTIVSVGAILGLCSACYGALFYLPRLLYSMACDGILCTFFSRINTRTHVPLYSIILSGLLSALIAMLVKLEILIQLMSLGMLFSYTLVSICIICIRYQNGILGLYMEYEDPTESDTIQCTHFGYAEMDFEQSKYPNKTVTSKYSSESALLSDINKKSHTAKTFNGYSKSPHNDETFQYNEIVKHQLTQSSKPVNPSGGTYQRFDSVISNTSNGSVTGLLRLPSDMNEPTITSWRTASVGLLMFIVGGLIMCVATLHGDKLVQISDTWLAGIVVVFIILLTSVAVLIAKQPQNRIKPFFKAPYVPFVPLVSILINMYLMASLPEVCWLRLTVWSALGLIVYFCYSYRHSSERDLDDQEVVLYEITDKELSSNQTI